MELSPRWLPCLALLENQDYHMSLPTGKGQNASPVASPTFTSQWHAFFAEKALMSKLQQAE
jgi:hypothetical protein